MQLDEDIEESYLPISWIDSGVRYLDDNLILGRRGLRPRSDFQTPRLLGWNLRNLVVHHLRKLWKQARARSVHCVEK